MADESGVQQGAEQGSVEGRATGKLRGRATAVDSGAKGRGGPGLGGSGEVVVGLRA